VGLSSPHSPPRPPRPPQLSAQSTHRTQPLPPLKLTILNCQHTTEGLFAAGIPIGTPMFQGTRAITCADLTCQLMEELQALPLADQDRCSWLLLQKSLQQRVAHLPQGCLWQHAGQAAQSAKSKAVDGALLGLAQEDGPLTAQITLPHRHSCLGLPHQRCRGIPCHGRHRTPRHAQLPKYLQAV
jgi:hypothetical protein